MLPLRQDECGLLASQPVRVWEVWAGRRWLGRVEAAGAGSAALAKFRRRCFSSLARCVAAGAPRALAPGHCDVCGELCGPAALTMVVCSSGGCAAARRAFCVAGEQRSEARAGRPFTLSSSSRWRAVLPQCPPRPPPPVTMPATCPARSRKVRAVERASERASRRLSVPRAVLAQPPLLSVSLPLPQPSSSSSSSAPTPPARPSRPPTRTAAGGAPCPWPGPAGTS